jgi:hypothetical protein
MSGVLLMRSLPPLVYVPNIFEKQMHVHIVRIACSRSKKLHTVRDARHRFFRASMKRQLAPVAIALRISCSCCMHVSPQSCSMDLAMLAHNQPETRPLLVFGLTCSSRTKAGAVLCNSTAKAATEAIAPALMQRCTAGHGTGPWQPRQGH